MRVPEINFSPRQWRVLFVVDTFIKALALFGPMLLASLGMILLGRLEAFIFFVTTSATMSGFHLLCLYVGLRLVRWLSSTSWKLPGWLGCVVLLVVANLLYGLGWAAYAASLRVYHGVGESLYFVATNLVSVTLVLGPGCLLRRGAS